MGGFVSNSKGSWALLRFEAVLGLCTKPTEEAFEEREETLDKDKPLETGVEFKWGLPDLEKVYKGYIDDTLRIYWGYI